MIAYGGAILFLLSTAFVAAMCLVMVLVMLFTPIRARLPLVPTRGLVAGNLVVGTGAALVYSALGLTSWWPVLGLHVLATTATYAVQLDQDVPWPDEPSSASGSVFGWHWFEFPSLPGRRLWTADAGHAAAVRARPADPDAMVQTDRPAQQLQAIRRTAIAVGFGVAAATVTTVVWDALVQTPDLPVHEALFVGLVVSAGTVLAHLSVSLIVFFTIWLVWNFIARPRDDRFAIENGVLATSRGQVPLRTHDRTTSLSWGPYGARLAVCGGGKRLVLNGPHANLSRLARQIEALPRGSAADQAVMAANLRAVQVER
jgi:hypothetical protein